MSRLATAAVVTQDDDDSPSFRPFELVDIAALAGDEHRLVTCVFERHTAAEAEVRDTDLASLDVPIPRARNIILSSLLVMAGIHAQEMQISPEEFATAALSARHAAGAALAVAGDVQGEA